MPHRAVLSISQRQAFEALPTELEALAQHYTLTEADLALIRDRRLAHNRLGFAIQLCLIRYPGRALRNGEELLPQLIEFVAEQTGDKPSDFAGYAERDQTRREHLSFLIRHFQLSTFTQQHFKEMVQWLVPFAEENPKSTVLVGAVLNELRHRRILHPPLSVVERLVAVAAVRADRSIFEKISAQLKDAHRKALDAWLTRYSEESQSRLAWVRQPPGRPSPRNVVTILEKLAALRALHLPDAITESLPPARRQLLAREGNRVAVQNLRSFGPTRRYAILAVCLLETHRTLIDEAISMHDRIVGILMRRGQRKQADQLEQDTKNIKRTVGLFSVLGKALIDAKETGKDPWLLIEEHLPWDAFCAAIKDAETLSQPRRFDYLGYIDTQYSHVRQYTPALLDHLDFHASGGSKDVLDAIELLREMNKSGKRKLPDDAPTSFVSSRWKPYVYQDGSLDRRYYELCALSELRNRLRSGDIWVPGSK
jgi:hypothetical protein